LAHIAIFLATFNGQKFLKRQLDSISSQEGVTWTLWVSDDGSQDDTRTILNEYLTFWGEAKLKIFQGPCQGFVKNFFSLLLQPEAEADYFAFCDQDDIWHPRKLVTAVRHIKQHNEKYVLYGGKTRLIDESGNYLGYSPAFSKATSFENALVQSIMGGNTMVFNKAVKDLLTHACQDVDVITHDWWAYQIVTACGGRVIYDPTPQVDYRQHPGNLVGMNQGVFAKVKRLGMLTSGYFQKANDKNIHALGNILHLMTPAAKSTLDSFEQARKARSLKERISAFLRSKVFRQSISGQCGLWLALLLRKL
jgi:glycosyltransferase involved in cell wall biosynthesis